jgi:hypothetical protein
VHPSGLIWCPAAKTGSTTIVQLLGGTQRHEVGPKASGGLYASTDLTLAEKRAVCERKHFTFTMTRDPFDRLVSTYLDKIVFPDEGNIRADGRGCQEARRRLRQVATFPTFEQFVEVLTQMPPKDHDVHTWPFSYRCGTASYHYDVLGRLSRFDADMASLFKSGGLGAYTPRHSNNGAHESEFASTNATIAKYGLRPDVLQMHGKERVEYFFTPRTRQLVQQGWWKHDCKQFAEY